MVVGAGLMGHGSAQVVDCHRGAAFGGDLGAGFREWRDGQAYQLRNRLIAHLTRLPRRGDK
ncbi:MAG TPA: hypothetical protein VKK19_06670 [Candidatus Dormibacteraeota bacterium]|nr:hypothetical protein [Candidatus Dormibacteraeota bacterium]